MSTINPDCAVGKCVACSGTAFDYDLDEVVDCTHECHRSE